jgi:hypothetical protein
MLRLSSSVLLALAVSWTVLAQSSPMREGLWEVTTKITIPGMGMDMPPMKQNQCVTAAMIKDPQSVIPKGPGQGDCKVANYKLGVNSATYTMTCAEPPMTATGEMKYSGTDAYQGTMKIDMSGQTMTLSYDAKRLGVCPK